MTSKPSSSQKLRPGSEKNPASHAPHDKPEAALYLVATPIGNLGDITDRARQLLAQADVIACEDTRVTRKLVQAYGLSAPLLAYHEHNAERVRPQLIERVKGGEVVALVSDAGTPLISDPGYKLVNAAIEAEIPVTTLPGASAPLTALLLSGLPSDRFFFNGFLPNKSGARKQVLSALSAVPGTLIFFESPHRLADSLADMAAVFGPRRAAVARELTKKFEEVRRDTLDELAAHYQECGSPKGEIVIVVAPPEKADEEESAESLDDKLIDALKDNSLRDAAALVATATGLPKKQVYQRALELSKAMKERD